MATRYPDTQNTIIEWPTLFLVLFIYTCWFTLLYTFNDLHYLLAVPTLILVLTLHSSLCHELIHGHPTRSEKINNGLGYFPIALIFPYTIFRETHLKHHDNKQITIPGIDPESFFVSNSDWQNMNRASKLIAWFNMTFGGRFLIGPMLSIVTLVRWSLRDIVSAGLSRKLMWICHYMLVALILVGVNVLFGIPMWLYAMMAYFSLSMIQVRSFYEHQPVDTAPHRSVIQQCCRFMSLLFLNNNYHYVHHLYPEMPWYRLRSEYFSNKEKYDAENGGFHYNGYGQWLKFLFKPVHSPIHPFS